MTGSRLGEEVVMAWRKRRRSHRSLHSSELLLSSIGLKMSIIDRGGPGGALGVVGEWEKIIAWMREIGYYGLSNSQETKMIRWPGWCRIHTYPHSHGGIRVLTAS